MLTYIIFFFSVCFFLFLSIPKDERISKALFSLVFIMIALFPGLRGAVGQDTYNYQILYEMYGEKGILSVASSLSTEPLFTVFSYLHYLFFDSYALFIFFIAAIQAFFLAYASKGLFHKRFFLLSYLLMFLLEYHFNAVRVGLAVSFFLCYLSDAKKNSRIVFMMMSLFTHFSVLVLLPVVLVREVRYAKNSPKNIFLISMLAIFSLSFVFLFSSDYILNKIEVYNLFSLEFEGFSVVATFFAFFAAFMILIQRERDADYVVAVCLFSFFYFISPFNDIIYRFVKILIPVVLFLSLEKKVFSFSNLSIRPKFFFIAIVVVWFSLDTWRYVVNEPEKHENSSEVKQNYTFLPYEINEEWF